MFAWTSVQAIFSTPGVELFRGNQEMGVNGRDSRKSMEDNRVAILVLKGDMSEGG